MQAEQIEAKGSVYYSEALICILLLSGENSAELFVALKDGSSLFLPLGTAAYKWTTNHSVVSYTEEAGFVFLFDA